MKNYIIQNVEKALHEDFDNIKKDITSDLIESRNIYSYVINREDMILCGKEWFNKTFELIKKNNIYKGNFKILWFFNDSDYVKKNNILCCIYGNNKLILSGERTALNFLQLLSGISSKTKQYINILGKNNIKLLDTRKTVPCIRYAQKYAVKCGGGYNHRFGLWDEILIKDNHISSADSLKELIILAKKKYPDKKITVEVENIKQLKNIINEPLDIFLLDNFSIKNIKKAVIINNNKKKLEVSGNINIKNIKKLKDLDIYAISVGELTKNIVSIDLSMKFLSIKN